MNASTPIHAYRHMFNEHVDLASLRTPQLLGGPWRHVQSASAIERAARTEVTLTTSPLADNLIYTVA